MSNNPKIKIVPDSDERWLSAAYGDVEARNSLVVEHLPLVTQIARTINKRLPPSVEEDDLISYGYLGLMKAVETYDAERASFRTYAAFKIKNSIYDGLRQEDWAPKTFRKIVKDVDKHREVLYNELQRDPTDEELGEAFGKSGSWVRTLKQTEAATKHHTFNDLEEQYGSVDNVAALATPSSAVETSAVVLQCQSVFASWLSQLPDVMKAVWLTAYYYKMTSKEASIYLGLKQFEYNSVHKQLIRSFDLMLSEVKKAFG